MDSSQIIRYASVALEMPLTTSTHAPIVLYVCFSEAIIYSAVLLLI